MPEETLEEVDPFDTTFASNLVPGRYELKAIENEILSIKEEPEFDPRAEEKPSERILREVSIKITNPAGQRQSLRGILLRLLIRQTFAIKHLF